MFDVVNEISEAEHLRARTESGLDHGGYNPNPPGKVLARIFTGLWINIYNS